MTADVPADGVGPDLQVASRGADAAIASYRAFTDGATISAFTSATPVVEVFATTAVAWISWAMTYTWEGAEYREAGHDTYVFARRTAGWRLVWRALASAPITDGTT